MALAPVLRPLLAVSTTLLVACADRRPAAPAEFAVARVRPAEGGDVFVNQRLTVYFNEPVDALSVTPDTVRVLDRDGHPVKLDRLEVGSQVVTVHPRTPLTASLDDGSFAPGGRYLLEVVGYPHVNAVRSRTGRILARGIHVPLAVVPIAGTPEYPRPLLPVGMGNEPFTLDPTRRLEVQVDSAVLRLHFTLPPYPPSVRPETFTVQRFAGTLHEVDEVDVVAARVVRDATDPYPGCSVELELRADPPLSLRDHLAMSLTVGEHGIVDYAGRSASLLEEMGGPIRHVHVRAGSQVEVVRLLAGESPRLQDVALGSPGFEIRDGRIVPRVRAAAGSGVHGVFAPTTSVRLGPSEALALAGGRVVWADATLELAGLEVPAGVRLTIGGFPGPVRILVTGSVRIAGEVVLETARSPVADFEGPSLGSVMLLRDDSLAGLAGCVIVAAGEIAVTGRIEHVGGQERMGPPLALVAGGRLLMAGTVPPGTICACEGELSGDLQSARLGSVRMRPGYSGLSQVVAEAHTAWVRVPSWAQGPIVARLQGADVGIEVFWQLGPPDSLDPGHVDRRADLWSQPRPVNEELVGAAGQFVRFLLRAHVMPHSRRLPGLDGIVLTTR